MRGIVSSQDSHRVLLESHPVTRSLLFRQMPIPTSEVVALTQPTNHYATFSEADRTIDSWLFGLSVLPAQIFHQASSGKPKVKGRLSHDRVRQLSELSLQILTATHEDVSTGDSARFGDALSPLLSDLSDDLAPDDRAGIALAEARVLQLILRHQTVQTIQRCAGLRAKQASQHEWKSLIDGRSMVMRHLLAGGDAFMGTVRATFSALSLEMLQLRERHVDFLRYFGAEGRQLLGHSCSLGPNCGWSSMMRVRQLDALSFEVERATLRGDVISHGEASAADILAALRRVVGVPYVNVIRTLDRHAASIHSDPSAASQGALLLSSYLESEALGAWGKGSASDVGEALHLFRRMTPLCSDESLAVAAHAVLSLSYREVEGSGAVANWRQANTGSSHTRDLTALLTAAAKWSPPAGSYADLTLEHGTILDSRALSILRKTVEEVAQTFGDIGRAAPLVKVPPRLRPTLLRVVQRSRTKGTSDGASTSLVWTAELRDCVPPLRPSHAGLARLRGLYPGAWPSLPEAETVQKLFAQYPQGPLAPVLHYFHAELGLPLALVQVLCEPDLTGSDFVNFALAAGLPEVYQRLRLGAETAGGVGLISEEDLGRLIAHHVAGLLESGDLDPSLWRGRPPGRSVRGAPMSQQRLPVVSLVRRPDPPSDLGVLQLWGEMRRGTSESRRALLHLLELHDPGSQTASFEWNLDALIRAAPMDLRMDAAEDDSSGGKRSANTRRMQRLRSAIGESLSMGRLDIARDVLLLVRHNVDFSRLAMDMPERSLEAMWQSSLIWDDNVPVPEYQPVLNPINPARFLLEFQYPSLEAGVR